MKNKLMTLLLLLIGLFTFVSCDEEVVDENYFDNEATEIDHYFSDNVRLSDTGTSVKKNESGKLAGDFIKDKIARLAPKSFTDGDTAVFHLNKYNTAATQDSYTVPGKGPYTYATIRFLGIDTPESTSSIDPWGKAASDYAKKILSSAEGIIVDATDCANEIISGGRLDSNGTRWLALLWYCPDGMDPENLDNYRLYQLDLIEECYSHYTGSVKNNRIAYNADKDKEPILYDRYKDTYGSMDLQDVLLEADIRMGELKLRIHGQQDPNYDYSKTATKISIKDALANIMDPNNENNYMNKGTLVEVTGVITRYIGNNLYLQDGNGACLYVYMGIEGNSIESLYSVGDTISIQGRLCEYGGQYQLSGVVFKSSTFKKVEGADAVAMPDPIDITDVELKQEKCQELLGKLVTLEFTCDGKSKSTSKDGSYTVYTTKEVKDIPGYNYDTGKNDDEENPDTIDLRINGTLAPGYEQSKWTNGTKYRVTGIMSIYSNNDLQETNNYPSFQILPGNRPVEDGVVVDEIPAV